MDGQTDGRYQTYHLPCFAVDKNRASSRLRSDSAPKTDSGLKTKSINKSDSESGLGTEKVLDPDSGGPRVVPVPIVGHCQPTINQ